MAGDGPALPYGRHLVDDDDIDAVIAVLRGDWLTTGPATQRFESALAQRCGAAHAVSCANGTAALHLACLALGIGPGDAAIVPAITFAATANAARLAGADVFFADVEADSGLMTVDHLAAAIARAEAAGKRPAVILPVHLGGQCVDLEPLSALARQNGMAIVEDACHALGTIQHRQAGDVAVGACADSDITVFSFHPVKTITAGEGGAVLTNDAALAERLARLRSHGITRDPVAFEDVAAGFDGAIANPWYYEMQELGLNYRLSDLNCALAASQLKKLNAFVAKRRDLAARYETRLARLAPLVRPIARRPFSQAAWHLFAVLIDFENADISRGQLARALERRGVRTQVHYIPVPHQPYYRRANAAIRYPGAEAYYRRTLSLPLYVGLSERDVDRVVDALADSLPTATSDAPTASLNSAR